MDGLISRAAAIDALMNDPIGKIIADRYNLIGWLEGFPSVDAVEVRHGRWIEDRYNNLDYVCSECGEPCAGMVMGKPRDRYCKWCGARMDGET